jgi:hypothetical protein
MNWLPEGEAFNSKYFCEQLLPDLRATRPSHRKDSKKPMIILHMDNAKPSRAKLTVQKTAELRMTSVPHHSVSPGIAPSDLYQFSYL